MIMCVDCKKQSENHKGWYADFTNEGKIMRCSDCGKQEAERRWNNRYGNRPRLDINEVDKQDRIQHSKHLRDVGLSPWRYRQQQ
jgi:NMD protein affecting ribosome stability and mRNA decay